MSWTLLVSELKLDVVFQLSLDDLNNLAQVHHETRRLLQTHQRRILRKLAERDLKHFFAMLVFTTDNDDAFLFTRLDPLPTDPLRRYLKLLKVQSVFNEVEPFYLRALACSSERSNRSKDLADAFLTLRQMGSLACRNMDIAYLNIMYKAFQTSNLKRALYDAICTLIPADSTSTWTDTILAGFPVDMSEIILWGATRAFLVKLCSAVAMSIDGNGGFIIPPAPSDTTWIELKIE